MQDYIRTKTNLLITLAMEVRLLPYQKIDRHNIFYTGNVKREGVPVLFCHGSGGAHHHWVYQLKGLNDKINPLAVDLPGHGRSEGLPANSIRDYREWLHIFCRSIDLGSCVLGGHSMGGAITLDYVLNYPDQLLGMILIGTGGRLRVLPDFLETLRKGTVPKSLVDYLYEPGVPLELLEKAAQEIESTNASVYYADLSACDHFDVMNELNRVTHPSLIICGSNDRLTPLKYSMFLKEKLVNSSLIEIPDAGHMVMLEKPDAVNQAINSFVAQLCDNN